MKYPFLKKTTSDSDVMCGTCETNFSVASVERMFSLMNKVWTSEKIVHDCKYSESCVNDKI